MNQTYIMSGIKSDFTTNYSTPISLDDSRQYEAALLSIDLFNSIPNITSLNNVLRYSKDGGQYLGKHHARYRFVRIIRY